MVVVEIVLLDIVFGHLMTACLNRTKHIIFVSQCSHVHKVMLCGSWIQAGMYHQQRREYLL